VELHNERFFGHGHWLRIYSTNLTLLENFTKKSGSALDQKYEQQRAPYRGETFEINYHICDERHLDAVNLKNAINYELVRF